MPNWYKINTNGTNYYYYASSPASAANAVARDAKLNYTPASVASISPAQVPVNILRMVGQAPEQQKPKPKPKPKPARRPRPRPKPKPKPRPRPAPRLRPKPKPVAKPPVRPRRPTQAVAPTPSAPDTALNLLLNLISGAPEEGFKYAAFNPKAVKQQIYKEQGGPLPQYYREQLDSLKAKHGYELTQEDQAYRQALREALGGYSGRGAYFSSAAELGLGETRASRERQLGEYNRLYGERQRDIGRAGKLSVEQEVANRRLTDYDPAREVARQNYEEDWRRNLSKRYQDQYKTATKSTIGKGVNYA